jgi:predicted aconitase with swiveling domain
MGRGMTRLAARVLVPGEGEGEVLHLESDLSFWGAIDPLTGAVIDRRHPQFGENVSGRIITLRRSIGSSSGSAILLEALHRGCGPAGIILGEPDQVLTLGAVVAREMGYANIPVLVMAVADFKHLPASVTITNEGAFG